MWGVIFAATVTLTWQAPPSTPGYGLPSGYKVFIGGAPGSYTSAPIDVGNVTTKQLTTNLPACFIVKAYNGFGDSSASNEMCAGPPMPPSGLNVQP